MSETLLHAAWARIGGGPTVAAAERRVDLEALLVATAEATPGAPRLFWVAASWLAEHGALTNPRRLGARLAEATPMARAVAGAMLTVAREHGAPSTQLESALRRCAPLAEPRPLFDVVREHPVLAGKAREGALPAFARWGLWQDEVSLRRGAVRPIAWVLARCPEFRSRALFGANLEAEVLDLLLALPASVQDMAEILEMTYAAVHEAASRLVARGWLARVRVGRRQVLGVREEMRGWIEAFPAAPTAGLGASLVA